jgi:hypothetical protein
MMGVIAILDEFVKVLEHESKGIKKRSNAKDSRIVNL